jgi:hypothetical protein
VNRRQAIGGLALLACGSAAARIQESSKGGAMHDVEVLAATRDIMTLKAQYFRFVDTRQWAAFKALFAPDATLFFPEGQDKPANLVDSLAFIKVVLQGTVSVHSGHSPEISIDSSTNARGIWGMEDRIYWSSEAAASSGLEYLNGFGHYHEEYVRRDDRWLFKSLKLTRLRVEKRSAPRAVA